LRNYYVEQCHHLLVNGYRLEAGLSIVPMPVTVVIERTSIAGIAARKTVLEAIQSFFPVPKLYELEDSVVDGWYQRRDESTAVNQESTLLDSVFWENYKEYLRSGKWKKDPAGLVRDRLAQSITRATATKRVSAFDESGASP